MQNATEVNSSQGEETAPQLYIETRAIDMGKAAAAFYKTLIDGLVPLDVAEQCTVAWVRNQGE